MGCDWCSSSHHNQNPSAQERGTSKCGEVKPEVQIMSSKGSMTSPPAPWETDHCVLKTIPSKGMASASTSIVSQLFMSQTPSYLTTSLPNFSSVGGRPLPLMKGPPSSSYKDNPIAFFSEHGRVNKWKLGWQRSKILNISHLNWNVFALRCFEKCTL